jgi:DNA-binding MarR family transcriptional regulator
LAQHLGVSLPTASVAVERLTRAGYLLPEPSNAGSRQRRLNLSPAGREAVEQAWQRSTTAFAGRLAACSEAELLTLSTALELLARTVQGGSSAGAALPSVDPTAV